MTLALSASLPVTVLTGFLGAGKTTLLNALLRRPALAGAAVIINEFGDVGIDHLLVDRVEGDMLMLTTGCLCCVARGDLVTALADLFDRRERGRVTFDRVIIETTGLADPGPLLNALLPTAGMVAPWRFDRLVTVVDATSADGTLDRSEEAMRQVALADVLVLSKTDRRVGAPEPSSALPSLTTRLRHINPSAPLLTTQDPEGVLEALRSAPVIASERAVDHRHHHSHLGGTEAFTLRTGLVDPSRFEAFIERLLVRHGAELLRLKGFVARVDDESRPVVVNIVQQRIHPASILQSWPDDDRGTRLVVIARSVAAEDIKGLWDAFFGPPRIDQADAAALSSGREEGPGLF